MEEQRREVVYLACPHCLHENEEDAPFCEHCHAPIGPTVTFDPLKRVYALGFAYRKAAKRPRSKIVLIGLWLIFAPSFLMPLALLGQGGMAKQNPVGFAVALVLPALILYKATSNYFKAGSTERKSP